MLAEGIKSAFLEQFGSRVLFHEALAPYVAYKIGGPADILVFPESEIELEWIRLRAREAGLPVTIIGTGTNLLIKDGGIRGVVISFLKGFQWIEAISNSADEILVSCGAGVQKPDLLQWAVERSFSGLEFSSGVPGTLGGGLFMNAGTKYGCYADILREFTVFDLESGPIRYQKGDFSFGYREQTALRPGRFVTSMVFGLRPGDKQAMQTEVARIIEERAEKQPLDFPSCGSTFKNPEGHSAGRLIERAGLKGSKAGGAEISLKHANFFLNKGDAKARDVLELIALTKDTVRQQFGVQLECEVIVLGEDESPQTVYTI